jgi:hypothetical protein
MMVAVSLSETEFLSRSERATNRHNPCKWLQA